MEDFRITKLREYLFEIINTLTTNRNYQINADFLGKVDDYSLDKVPTELEVEQWIVPISIHRDVYTFRSRKFYSKDTINNLNNIGFFEDFESKIKSNNEKGNLPNIEGIESIECLTCGALNSIDGTQATFNIQIQITYRDIERGNVSL